MNRPFQSIALLAAAALLLTATGCGLKVSTPPSVPPTLAPAAAPAATEPSDTAGSQGAPATSSASADAPKLTTPSAKALEYAKSIGGFDHKGQQYYFIVGGTFGTEAEAQAALDKATRGFGDRPAFFVVQHSDSFAGMTPGQWVVVEAHFKTPTDDNLEFARRGFPNARVQRARVVVSAPIPLFEDMVGGD